MKDQSIKIKASSLENLHKIVVDLVALSNNFCSKYPEFNALLSVSHKNLHVTLQINRGENE